MAGYGLTGKRLQPARLRNLYGGLQLRETTAAYGGLRRRLRGLDGMALQWINSFLTNHTQAVAFRGATSAYTLLRYGVPQGSVLGPVLFLLYTADVATMAHGHGVSVHCSRRKIQGLAHLSFIHP